MKSEHLIRQALIPTIKKDGSTVQFTKKHKKSVSAAQIEREHNNSGVEITGEDSANKVKWGDLNQKKRQSLKPLSENISEWSLNGFFRYIMRRYVKQFGQGKHLTIGNVLVLQRLKDDLIKQFGFCDNVLMKNYIDFFWTNYADRVYLMKGELYFNEFRRKAIITQFSSVHDHAKAISKMTTTTITEHPKKSSLSVFSKHNMDQTYLLGVPSLLMEYGLMLSVNFLMVQKKMDQEKSVILVNKAMDMMKNEQHRTRVVSRTVKYWPLPSNFYFQDIESFLHIVSEKELKGSKTENLDSIFKAFSFLGAK